jgi:hypothetical protein
MSEAPIPLACRGRNYPIAALSSMGVIRVRSDEPGFEWYDVRIRFSDCLQSVLQLPFPGFSGITYKQSLEIQELSKSGDGVLLITDVVGVVSEPSIAKPFVAKAVFYPDRFDYHLRVDCENNPDFWLEIHLPSEIVYHLRFALRDDPEISRGRNIVVYGDPHVYIPFEL